MQKMARFSATRISNADFSTGIIDKWIFTLLLICFILWVYRPPFMFNIDIFGMSLVGSIFRFLLILIFIKIIIERKLQINHKVILLFLFLFISYLSSNLYGKYIYGNNEHLYIPLKTMIRYLLLFAALCYSLNRLNKINKLLQITLIFCIFMVIAVRLNLLGYATIIGDPGYLNVFVSRGEPFGYGRESFGILDTNYYAFLLSINILIAFYFLITSRNKLKKYVLYLPVLMFFIYNIFKTVSIGGLLTMVVGFLVFSSGLKIKRFHRSVTYILIAILIILLVLYLLPENLINIITLRISIIKDTLVPIIKETDPDQAFVSPEVSTASKRIAMAWLAFNQFLKSPIFGSGGNSSLYYSSYFRSQSHTDYTNWLANYGLITFIPFLLIQLFFYSKLKNKKKSIIKKSQPFVEIIQLGLTIQIMFLFNALFSPVFKWQLIFFGLIYGILYCSKDLYLNKISIKKGRYISDYKILQLKQ